MGYDENSVVFVASPSEISQGVFTVTVRMEPQSSQNIGGIWISLFYDKDAFVCQSQTKGGGFGAADLTYDGNNGMLHFVWEGSKTTALEEVLFTAIFSIRSGADDGPYDFSVICRELYDTAPEMNDIEFYEEPGSVWVGERLTLSDSAIELFTGESTYIGSNKAVSVWQSQNPGIATVSQDGMVTGESEGSTVITAYGGLGEIAYLNVTVKKKSLSAIGVKTQPTKLTYQQGEAFDPNGMPLELSYDDGSVETVSTGFTTSYNFSAAGTQTVTVSYGGKTCTLSVTVVSTIPSSITSGAYAVSGGFISKIPAGTTVSQLIANLNEKEYIQVFDNGAAIPGASVVGTGMVVQLMDGAAVKQSVTVIVTGDTNGDGAISITDMLAVKSHLLNKSQLSGAAEKAADTNGDKTISITDFLQIKAHILGKETIRPGAV